LDKQSLSKEDGRYIIFYTFAEKEVEMVDGDEQEEEE
jgi:hypothetical protein